jgi:hypothetical protein
VPLGGDVHVPLAIVPNVLCVYVTRQVSNPELVAFDPASTDPRGPIVT